MQINEAILKVEKEYDGKVVIRRYLLNQQGPKFMQNPEVLSLLKSRGIEALPVTTLGGKVVKRQSYPTYDELRGMLRAQGNGKS
jgi:hypothetical protein